MKVKISKKDDLTGKKIYQTRSKTKGNLTVIGVDINSSSIYKKIHQTRSKTKGNLAVIGVHINNSSIRKSARNKNIRLKSTRKKCDLVDNTKNPADCAASADHVQRVWTCRTCTFKNYSTLSCAKCGTNWDVIPSKDDTFEVCAEIMKKFESTQKKFVDDSFPASSESLYINRINWSMDSKSPLTKLWLRPENMSYSYFNRKWTMSNYTAPSDICQGALGNCWFIAAMIVVSERAELLNYILETKEINPAGAYIIRLNKDGRWKDILVDDLLPCNDHDQLIFAKSKDKQLWVPLIEKAMAKLNGSYEALFSGYPEEGLMTLTGFHCEKMVLHVRNLDFDLTWRTLLSNRAADFLMVASTDDEKMSDEEFKEVGLASNHAYAILDAIDVDECNCKLIKLRNPHGKTSWNGDWSDKSRLWTVDVELKERLKPKSHLGIFWMCLQDFLTYFSYIDVCRVRTSWEHYGFQGVFGSYTASDYLAFSIKVSQPTEIDVATIIQNWSRDRKELGTQWNPNELGMVLFQATTDIILHSQLVENTLFERKRTANFCRFLDPGQYYLVPVLLTYCTDNDGDETCIEFVDFEVSVYSFKRIECSQLLVGTLPFLLTSVTNLFSVLSFLRSISIK